MHNMTNQKMERENGSVRPNSQGQSVRKLVLVRQQQLYERLPLRPSDTNRPAFQSSRLPINGPSRINQYASRSQPLLIKATARAGQCDTNRPAPQLAPYACNVSRVQPLLNDPASISLFDNVGPEPFPVQPRVMPGLFRKRKMTSQLPVSKRSAPQMPRRVSNNSFVQEKDEKDDENEAEGEEKKKKKIGVPGLKLQSLCYLAMHNSPRKKLICNEIYNFLMLHFPIFRQSLNKGWTNSIRHALTAGNTPFQKAKFEEGDGRSAKWEVKPDRKSEQEERVAKWRLDGNFEGMERPDEIALMVFGKLWLPRQEQIKWLSQFENKPETGEPRETENSEKPEEINELLSIFKGFDFAKMTSGDETIEEMEKIALESLEREEFETLGLPPDEVTNP